MELICNELSFYPLAENVSQVEQRFKILFDTFKEAKKRLGFNKIRFQNNLSTQSVTPEDNFIQAVSSFNNSTLKNVALTFLAPPYLDDLTEEEIEAFLESNYEITSQDCPNNDEPYGLPVAHIKSLPTISFKSHSFWKNSSIKLRKVDSEGEVLFEVPNICTESDLDSDEFSNWKDVSFSKTITTKEALIQFLGISKYSLNVSDNFFAELMEWKEQEIKIYSYTLALMKDVELHPFTGGMGRTENLKNRGKEASKRITNRYPDGDRLSYSIENNELLFIACKGHYNFH